ncbi:MAG TPA: NTP transferase domain-containing protein, partial [Caldimonas sp.]
MVLNVVIMAAGQGTRMRSARPKVLHTLAGRHLLQHVLGAAAGLGSARIVVVTGHGADEVERALGAPGLAFVRQEPQLGTGHAIQQAAPLLDDAGTTLVLNGDVPLIETETLRRLVAAAAGGTLALLTVEPSEPRGYGRIVRSNSGAITAIIEEKDASDAQRAIREVYTGAMAAPTRLLKRWLALLTNANAAGEYYLTDVVKSAVGEGVAVTGVAASGETEVLGV